MPGHRGSSCPRIVALDLDLPDLEGALGAKVARTTATSPDYVAWLNS